MTWLNQIKVLPQWLIVARVLAGFLLGAAVATATAGRVSEGCRAELQEVVHRLFGL